MGGQHGMGAGQIVSVDASLQPDGTWVASHVQSHMASGGAMSGGVIATVTGTPPTQLLLVTHDGAGGGMMASSLAGTTTVNIGDATTYAIDAVNVDLANLPFTPRFDRATVSAGQRVEALSTSQWTHGGGMHGMSDGGTLTAASVRLEQQGLRGTVSGYTASGAEATFATVPADSAFARITGKTSVTVYQRATNLAHRCGKLEHRFGRSGARTALQRRRHVASRRYESPGRYAPPDVGALAAPQPPDDDHASRGRLKP